MDICEYAALRNRLSQSYWHEPADEPYFHITMGQLISWAANKWGDDEAFVCVHDNVRLSFREIKEKTDKLSAALLELGIYPGDTLALLGSASSTMYITGLAAACAGLTLVDIGRHNNAPQLAHCLTKVEAKALLVIELTHDNGKFCKVLHQAIPELMTSKPGDLQSKQFPKLKIVITFGSTSYFGAYNYEELLHVRNPSGMKYVNRKYVIQPDDRFIAYFTSGSTGMPKCVSYSHHTIINSSYKNITQYGLDQKGHRIFTTLVIFRGPAMRFLIVRSFLFGTTAIFGNADLSGESIFNILQSERVTSFLDDFTPFVDIIRSVKEKNKRIKYLENVFIIGSAVTKTLASEIMKVLLVKSLYVGYGLTECGRIGYSHITNDVENVSVYRVMKNLEVKVVDTQGKMMSIGQPGELWVRGFSVMDEYLNDHERTAECKTPDGWLKTGDVFIFEENGCIRFVSRIKDIILKCGDNIYLNEIENFLCTHPSVNEAHAIGIPDYRVGEELCVFVHANNENLTEEDIKNYCGSQLADFEIPRYVRFLTEFPKCVKGKVSKMKLLEMFESDEEYVERSNELHDN